MPTKIGRQSENNTQLQNIRAALVCQTSSGLSSKCILDALPLPAAWTRQDAKTGQHFTLRPFYNLYQLLSLHIYSSLCNHAIFVPQKIRYWLFQLDH